MALATYEYKEGVNCQNEDVEKRRSIIARRSRLRLRLLAQSCPQRVYKQQQQKNSKNIHDHDDKHRVKALVMLINCQDYVGLLVSCGLRVY